MHPEKVIASAQAVIASDETGGHSADDVTCPTCQAFWRHLAGTAKNSGQGAIALLADTLPPDGHPNADCVPCDGCRLELDIAMTTIALGSAGIDGDLAWGPGHTASQLHDPSDWADCRACTQWASERAHARTVLTAAGIDADRWLGADDTPN